MADQDDGRISRVWLKGFLRGVDCRPVQFRDTLGATLACNLCGLVDRRTASLPCSHVFCEFCFGQSADGSFDTQRRCIFDGDVFDVGHVRWNETQPLSFVKAKVRCWNARYGCDFTGPLRGLLDHFERDCTFHAVICPRCQSMQLRSKLADHYRGGCVAPPTATSRWGNQLLSDSAPGGGRDAATFAPMQDTLAVFESKMNELLEHMRTLGTRTSLLHADMTSAKETLARLLSQGATAEGVDLLGPSAVLSSTAPIRSRVIAPGIEDTSVTRASPAGPLSRLLRRRGEKCVLRIAFRKSDAEHTPEADLSSPLDSEVWITRCVTPDGTCNVKLVLLEEGAALCVYAAADQCVDVFNPWTLRSVGFTSHSRLFPPCGPPLLTPTWQVSRQSRASLLDQGFARFRSRPLEEIFRRGFFFQTEEEVLILRVKLMRKFDVL